MKEEEDAKKKQVIRDMNVKIENMEHNNGGVEMQAYIATHNEYD